MQAERRARSRHSRKSSDAYGARPEHVEKRLLTINIGASHGQEVRRQAAWRQGEGLLMPQFPLVRVEWTDSATVEGWVPLAEAEFEPIRCVTVGFLVEDSDAFVALAASIANGGVNKTGQACQIMCIPRAAIIRSELMGAADA